MNILKIISTGLFVCCVLVINSEAGSRISGLDEPGSTQWSDKWYGTIADVLPLDYDAFPLSVSVDSLRQKAFITFTHSAPYIRTVSVDDLNTGEIIRWNHALGTILTSAQNKNDDKTLFLSRQMNHSFLIQTSNTDNAIEHVYRLDCQAAAPLVYSSSTQSIFFRNNLNSSSLYKFCPESRMLEELTIDVIQTRITDIIPDIDGDILYVLSEDVPGDIVQVSADSFQVVNTITLPGNLLCSGGIHDQFNNHLIVIAREQNSSLFSLVQICLNTFTTGITNDLPSDWQTVLPAGVCENTFVMAVSGASSFITRFNSADFTIIDSADCSVEFGQIGYAATSNDVVILVDNSIPANIETFCCETMSLTDSQRLPGEDGWLYCMAVNPVHDQLMISRQGYNPATLILVDMQTFTRSGQIDYYINDDGWFIHLEADANGQFTYGFLTGTQSYLVRICNDTYQVDHAEPVELTGYVEQILVDDAGSYLFVIHGQTLSRHDLNTLQLQEELVIDNYPGGTLKTLMLDPATDRLILANVSGQVFKVSKTPLNIIDEAILTEVQGSITSGIMIAEKDMCVFSVYLGMGEPAKLTIFNNRLFEFTEVFGFNNFEFEVRAFSYCPSQKIFNCGVSEGFGSFYSFCLLPLDLVNQTSAQATSRFVWDSVYQQDKGISYWSNCHYAGSIQKSSNHGGGYLKGSGITLDIPANVTRLSWYSHHSDGNVRLAVYDSDFQKLWESPVIDNDVQEDWLIVPISEGIPDKLHLHSGEYWLTFQVDGTKRSGSTHAGNPGDGLRHPALFGHFPDVLWDVGYTSDRWVINAEWEPLYPTATPTTTGTPAPTATSTAGPEPTETPSPTASPTFLPTVTPTSEPTETPPPDPTHTPSPSPSSIPTETPSPFPTSTPETTGVELILNREEFNPGDIFRLEARIIPPENVSQRSTLWVILDVYGSYWFGPAWTQIPDCYILPEFDKPVHETILYFVWPDNCGVASGLAFWGAILDADTNELLGAYDKVYFSYQD